MRDYESILYEYPNGYISETTRVLWVLGRRKKEKKKKPDYNARLKEQNDYFGKRLYPISLLYWYDYRITD